jgi:hypothetical protein
VWTDKTRQAGEEWRRKIDAALNAAHHAVLLISQNFVASKFISEEELPRILARKAAGELEVLPVFLSPCLAETEIPYTDNTGRTQKYRLSELQGVGTPDKPLSTLPKQQREQAYVKLAEHIHCKPSRQQLDEGGGRLAAGERAFGVGNLQDFRKGHRPLPPLTRCAASLAPQGGEG